MCASRQLITLRTPASDCARPTFKVWPFVYYCYFKRKYPGEHWSRRSNAYVKFWKPIATNFLFPAAYDPLTFVGLPKAWRGDVWNWLDAFVIVTTMRALSYGMDPLSDETREAYMNAVVLAIGGLYLNLLGYLRATNLKCT